MVGTGQGLGRAVHTTTSRVHSVFQTRRDGVGFPVPIELMVTETAIFLPPSAIALKTTFSEGTYRRF